MSIRLVLAGICVVVTASAVPAQETGQEVKLFPGAPAPKIEVKNWIKGSKFSEFGPKGVYVVEFWATWCGPCLQSIPHITELAKKNPNVTFLGVSIWEDDKDGSVAKFVEKMGDKMAYNVAYSGNQEGMAQTWMRAAGQNGIPSAFIVQDKVIRWIGHPMEMEAPLAAVLSGKHDLAAERKQFDKRMAKEAAFNKIQAELAGIQKQFDGGDRAGAKAKLDQIVKENPDFAGQADRMKTIWLASEDPAAFGKQVDAMLAKDDQDAWIAVGELAARLSAKEATRAVATDTIAKALKASKESDLIVLYYGTVTYRQVKDADRAKQVARQAIALMDRDKSKGSAQMREYFESLLKG